MTFMTALERRFRWIAIEHLPLYVVSAQALLALWALVNPESRTWFTLDPLAIQYGREYWRLFTFLFLIPPMNPIFAFFYLYLLYIYAMALETQWGSFPFTIFYLVGAMGTIVAAFFLGSSAGAFYLNMSIFLAFAALHGDFVLYLFFVIPVKVKWLAWLTWAYFAYGFVLSPNPVRMAILISLANYFLFFSKHHWTVLVQAIRHYQHKSRFKNWPQ